MTAQARAAAPHGALSRGRSAPVPVPPGVRGRPFFAVEIQTYQPGAPVPPLDLGHGARPRGALARTAGALESIGSIRASDVGYRTRQGEAGAGPDAVQCYPGILTGAFALDRALTLTPDADLGSLAVGAVALDNSGRRFDGIAQAQNSDSRPVSILAGTQLLHPTLGVWADPPYADLDRFWTGAAQSWQLSETVLSVPLRDASYLLQRPLQAALYGGAGGLDGTADLAGRPKPYLRGTALNLTPVLIDPVNLIYQVSDAPGQVLAVSEGGDPTNIPSGGAVDSILLTAPGAGHYVVESSARGLFFRLATKPVRTITCDAIGAFPAAGSVATAVTIARALLLETMGLPAAMLDQGTFLGLDAAYPYLAGLYYGADPVSAADAVGALLASLGAKLLTTRDGRFRPIALRAPDTGLVPLDTWTAAELVSLAPQSLPAALDPPPASWTVGWGRNYTPMASASDLDPDVVGTARQTWLAAALRTAGWAGPGVAAAWRSANRPATVGGQLASQADAAAVAARLGALWAPNNRRRRLYAAVVPTAIGRVRDIGDAVVIAYPLDDLAAGRLGLVVGEQYRSQDDTITFTVLI